MQSIFVLKGAQLIRSNARRPGFKSTAMSAWPKMDEESSVAFFRILKVQFTAWTRLEIESSCSLGDKVWVVCLHAEACSQRKWRGVEHSKDLGQGSIFEGSRVLGRLKSIYTPLRLSFHQETKPKILVRKNIPERSQSRLKHSKFC